MGVLVLRDNVSFMALDGWLETVDDDYVGTTDDNNAGYERNAVGTSLDVADVRRAN